MALEKSVASLGADPGCDVVLAGPGVAASHALVFRDGGGWSIAAAGKGRELKLNGQRTESGALVDGDLLSVGKLELRFEAGPAPQPDSAAQAGIVSGLAAFAARLMADRPARELLQVALAGLAEAAGADDGFLVAAEKGGRRVLASTRAVPVTVVSDSLVERVLSAGVPVLAADVAGDAGLADAPSVVALRIASALGIPLRAPGGAPAVIYLGRTLGRPPFGAGDLDAATALSSLTALLLASSLELRELRFEVGSLTQRVAAATFEGMVGESVAMRELYRRIERIAPTSLNVLVTGETGTGKELVARALHRRSGRSGPFLAFSCAAVPESLAERELFGHVRGAFSGATGNRPGVFEAAHGGTLFLDEAGEMPPSLQVKLLRVIQERELTRLGETRVRKVDVRLIAATHVDLKAAIMAGRFREDLRYRLDEVGLEVPPLRERGDDALIIAHRLLSGGGGPTGFTLKAAEALRGHRYPGNVRELCSMVRRALALCQGELVSPADLGFEDAGEPLRSLDSARDEFVRRYVREAIALSGGSKKRAAEALGIGLRSLFRYLGEEP